MKLQGQRRSVKIVRRETRDAGVVGRVVFDLFVSIGYPGCDDKGVNRVRARYARNKILL